MSLLNGKSSAVTPKWQTDNSVLALFPRAIARDSYFRPHVEKRHNCFMSGKPKQKRKYVYLPPAISSGTGKMILS
jgi:hypothetical protein